MNNIIEKAAKKIKVSIIVTSQNEEWNVITIAMEINE